MLKIIANKLSAMALFNVSQNAKGVSLYTFQGFSLEQALQQINAGLGEKNEPTPFTKKAIEILSYQPPARTGIKIPTQFFDQVKEAKVELNPEREELEITCTMADGTGYKVELYQCEKQFVLRRGSVTKDPKDTGFKGPHENFFFDEQFNLLEYSEGTIDGLSAWEGIRTRTKYQPEVDGPLISKRSITEYNDGRSKLMFLSSIQQTQRSPSLFIIAVDDCDKLESYSFQGTEAEILAQTHCIGGKPEEVKKVASDLLIDYQRDNVAALFSPFDTTQVPTRPNSARIPTRPASANIVPQRQMSPLPGLEKEHPFQPLHIVSDPFDQLVTFEIDTTSGSSKQKCLRQLRELLKTNPSLKSDPNIESRFKENLLTVLARQIGMPGLEIEREWEMDAQSITKVEVSINSKKRVCDIFLSTNESVYRVQFYQSGTPVIGFTDDYVLVRGCTNESLYFEGSFKAFTYNDGTELLRDYKAGKVTSNRAWLGDIVQESYDTTFGQSVLKNKEHGRYEGDQYTPIYSARSFFSKALSGRVRKIETVATLYTEEGQVKSEANFEATPSFYRTGKTTGTPSPEDHVLQMRLGQWMYEKACHLFLGQDGGEDAVGGGNRVGGTRPVQPHRPNTAQVRLQRRVQLAGGSDGGEAASSIITHRPATAPVQQVVRVAVGAQNPINQGYGSDSD